MLREALKTSGSLLDYCQLKSPVNLICFCPNPTHLAHFKRINITVTKHGRGLRRRQGWCLQKNKPAIPPLPLHEPFDRVLKLSIGGNEGGPCCAIIS